MNFIGIIPARYASSRFPGKPLAMIGGKPMIQRVYEQAKKALDYVVVATDDERIFDCVTSFGGLAVMTSADHPCGTNRCQEAYERCSLMVNALIDKGELPEELPNVKWNSHQDVVINIQGDEPFIQPKQIEAVKACFMLEGGQIATLVKPFSPQDGLAALRNPNSPKVVIAPLEKAAAITKVSATFSLDASSGVSPIASSVASPADGIIGKAVYFSRSVIPYLRGVKEEDWLQEAERKGQPFYKHIGLYAYRADVLAAITRLPLSPLEQAESLEQLRWIENGYEIRVALTEQQTIGIDTPEDLQQAEVFLKQIEDK